LVLAAVVAYVVGLVLFFTRAAPLMLALGAVLLTGVVLINYFAAIGATLFGSAGWEDSPYGDEPAYRQYFFRKAYYDYGVIVRDSFRKNAAAGGWVLEKGRWLFTNTWRVMTWPAGVLFYPIAAIGAVAAVVAYAALGAAHLLLVMALALLALLAAAAARALEGGSMLWRRIFLVCPHAGCHQPIVLPAYRCPDCGAEHRRLIPGWYGILRRRCGCGSKLPTLFMLGRATLPAYCPNTACQRPLSGAIGSARNLHIPIVGGPSAGKTSFVMANLVELRERTAQGELKIEFPEKKDQLLFDACQSAFAGGQIVQKTASYSPDAFLARLEDVGGASALLYLYDAAGELFQSDDKLRGESYYSFIHGLLILIDGFSLPRVQVQLGRALSAAAQDLKPCQDQPQDVYDRLMRKVRENSRMSKRMRNVPVAVVVSKTDALNLAQKIQEAEPEEPSKGRTDPQARRSDAVRAWLEKSGEGNLVRSIENDFHNVAYFACSSLGRMPDRSARPFLSKGALAPVAWLLARRGVRIR
jgi:hypothetical protein